MALKLVKSNLPVAIAEKCKRSGELKYPCYVNCRDTIFEIFNAACHDENCETIIITGRKRSDQKITEVTVALAERSEYIVVELSDSTTEHAHTVDLIEFYFYRQVQAIASAKFSCREGESLKWQYSARPTGIKNVDVRFYHKIRPSLGWQSTGWFATKKSPEQLSQENHTLEMINQRRKQLEQRIVFSLQCEHMFKEILVLTSSSLRGMELNLLLMLFSFVVVISGLFYMVLFTG
jgi:hypothetical protein